MLRGAFATLAMGLGALALMGARCERPPRAEARVPASHAGSCDGIVDYGDEFEVSNLSIVWVELLSLDLVEAEIDVELRNLGPAQFRAATLRPDFAAAPLLGVLPGEWSAPADFGPIEPYGTARSTVPLRLQLPAANFAQMMRELGNGTVPLVVHADEQPVLREGVNLMNWTFDWDARYRFATEEGVWNQGPFSPIDPPGTRYDLVILDHPKTNEVPPPTWDGGPPDDIPPFDLAVVCPSWNGALCEMPAGESFYLLPGEDRLYGLPRPLQYVRIVSLVADYPVNVPGYGTMTAYYITVERSDGASLPDLYETTSACTGKQAHIDPEVQRTRIHSLDGDPVDDETRDTAGQPIRFNELTFSEGIVTVKGQVGGHVLKPSFSLRLRDGHVETGLEFDTDVAFGAEIRAEDDVTIDPEDQLLWEHCFKIPPLIVGPVPIEMNLQLRHTVGMEGSLAAGAVVGFQKRYQSGFSIECQGGPGVAEECTTDRYREPTPIDWTPPQFTEETGFEIRGETTLSALLRIGAPYPFCDAGPGISIETTGYAEMGVFPMQTPWYSGGYGVELNGAAEFELFGLDVERIDVPLFQAEQMGTSSDLVEAIPGSPPPAPVGERSVGGDQRWAVAIDDTGVPNGVDLTAIAALPDGSSIAIATEAIGGRNPVVKLDRNGAMQWSRESDKKVARVRALPDGTVILVGANAWLARIDAAGNLLWSFDAEIGRTEYAGARCVLADVVAIERTPGIYDYVGVGRMGASIVTQGDACALRVNADATLAWARHYVGERVQEFRGATATFDGHVVAVGNEHMEIFGRRSVPLFVKLDPATGDVRWWKALPMMRGAWLEAVVEADDGTLYAVGSAGRSVVQTGAALFARIGPDGTDAYHAMPFQDVDWELLLDFEAWLDTEGGDTAYDTFFDLVPQGDGFVAVGSTGLGGDTAAWVARFNRKFGVEWLSTFDGSEADVLSGVALTHEAVLVSGHSGSLPVAGGGSGPETQLWAMKLPFNGTLLFGPGVPMDVRFLATAVRDSSTDDAVNPFDETTADVPFAIEESVVISSGPNTGLIVPGSNYCARLLTLTGQLTTSDNCPD